MPRKLRHGLLVLGQRADPKNLVFMGGVDGLFSAYNATTGERLWSYTAVSGINAAPMTYSVNDTQYVAVAVGRPTLPWPQRRGRGGQGGSQAYAPTTRRPGPESVSRDGHGWSSRNRNARVEREAGRAGRMVGPASGLCLLPAEGVKTLNEMLPRAGCSTDRMQLDFHHGLLSRFLCPLGKGAMLEKVEHLLGHLTTVHDERMGVWHDQKGSHSRQLGTFNPNLSVVISSHNP